MSKLPASLAVINPLAQALPANVPNPADKTAQRPTVDKAAARRIKADVAALKELEALPLSSDQCEALVDMGLLALEEGERREAWDKQFPSYVRRVFPTVESMVWGFYKPLAAYIRANYGTFAYQRMRAALAVLAEEYGCDMPTAGAGTGKGKKGTNPKRAYAAVRSACDTLVEKIVALKKCDVNANVLAEWTPIIAAIRKAQEHTSKAVNE